VSTVGEVAAAIRAGYRVAIHAQFFPFRRHGGDDAEIVHAVVDHGARAIFCSQEWYEKSRPVAK
jgi:hypothetical protein